MLRICILAALLASTAFAQAPVAPQPLQASVPEFAELKAVPHGELRVVWYDSKTYGMQRRMQVYTPPGYERSSAKYPVLYLIHGGGAQDDTTWASEGRAGFILDNLLAAGQIKPMIVVMPNGNSVPPNPNRAGVDTDTLEGLARRAFNAAKTRDSFVSDLLTGIIPYVDSTYRVRATRENRAIAGLSFGGTETLWAATSNIDKFAWIGVFSMGLQIGSSAEASSISGSGTGSPADFVKDKAVFFANSQSTNKLVKLFWIGVGADDHVVANGPKQLSATLTAHGIRHEYHETEGGHDFTNWRHYLWDFAPLLFR